MLCCLYLICDCFVHLLLLFLLCMQGVVVLEAGVILQYHTSRWEVGGGCGQRFQSGCKSPDALNQYVNSSAECTNKHDVNI